jgi:hypothetical protein
MSVRNVWSVGRPFGVGSLRLEGVITLVHHSLKDVSVVLLNACRWDATVEQVTSLSIATYFEMPIPTAVFRLLRRELHTR